MLYTNLLLLLLSGLGVVTNSSSSTLIALYERWSCIISPPRFLVEHCKATEPG